MVTNQPISPALPRLCVIDQMRSFQGAPEAGVPIKMDNLILPAMNKIEVEFLEDDDSRTVQISEYVDGEKNSVFLEQCQAIAVCKSVLKWLKLEEGNE